MWLPSPLYVAFAPDGVRYCSQDPVSRKVRDQGVIPLPEGAALPDWQPWVAALAGWVGERPKQRFNLHVVLFDGFVRYQLLPWRPGIVGAAEWQAYAGHRFREVYGDLPRGWHVLVAPTPPGEAAIVAAIDNALPGALRTLTPYPPRLVSVQPRFVAGFNHWRRRLKGESFWFATVEPGRACLGLVQGKRWTALRNESLGDLSSHGLAQVLHRIDLTVESPASAALYVSADPNGVSLPLELGGRPVHSLQIPERWSEGRRQFAASRGL